MWNESLDRALCLLVLQQLLERFKLAVSVIRHEEIYLKSACVL